MTYGEAKRMALRLAFTDSIAGDQIPDTYNNQADYTNQIPGLVDSALMDIVTRAKHIPALVMLDDLDSTEQGAFTVYTMPYGYQDMMHGGLIATTRDGYSGEDRIIRYRGYRLIGGQLYVPRNAPQHMQMEYWRYPTSVGNHPDDFLQLDGTPDMHPAIPYYVAAQLCQYDDAFRYQANRNEYETKIALLHDPIFVEEEPINDVYNFNGGSWY